ncbi:MAG: sigma-70 family RNA polymerase sigma factor [Actinomycetota bacterium]|nr:sigma-70 family RNA polymerase sigma factor [Actinomycetota bacterium]
MDLFRRQPSAKTDEERFDAIYRAYYERVLAFALRRAKPEVAHDVVAETFLVAWRRLDRVPGEPLAWLLGVARKALANHHRAARRRDALLTELKAHHRTRLHEQDAATATVGELAEALARLPGTDQELLQLIAWDALTVSEAAEVFGVSTATCRVRVHRARRRLSQELARGEEVRAPHEVRPFPHRLGDTRP